MKTKTTVIYHRADFDGIFCREIARKFLPEAELIGWDYNDPKICFPLEGEVYVLDLSPECFSALPDHTDLITRLIWIDHHKSAIEKWSAGICGYRIDGVAACRLAWQWFSFHESGGHLIESASLPSKQEFVDRMVSEPKAVRLAGEYDIWDKRDPNAELLQHGLRGQELTPDKWEDLFSADSVFLEKILYRGQFIQYAQTRSNESIIKEMGFTFQWEGLTFLGCNAARYNSLLFTAGLKPEHDACFGFKWTGKDWSVSLYGVPGKPDLDLSTIAVKYGGGGHRQACGFRTTKLPFLNDAGTFQIGIAGTSSEHAGSPNA